MPHINRIRVNNVKYNFGTQFYDDFILRMDGKNTLYDLANGGGKSVLMLLLFQNLIPNCTLDEKQPVEKFFRTDQGSKTIHSLIEWKLDKRFIRDNYKYMLTGFCARKAREELRETAAIEYFNYVIFYREYNDNDLVNLPLSDGKERVTYSGLKAYLRELGKKDMGLEVYIFDRKGEYQQFISRYGLYESHWEILRGINKTEGHVRTYFETHYRTTRKIVEDLLIEEIIQRAAFQNEDQSADMADTLVKIKDKLAELALRKKEMGCYDRQSEILHQFSENIEWLLKSYKDKEQTDTNLVKAYHSVVAAGRTAGKSRTVFEKERDYAEKHIREISRKLETIRIQENQEQLDRLENDTEAYKKVLEGKKEELAESKKQLALTESMNDYSQYLKVRAQWTALKEFLAQDGRDTDGMLEELHSLASQKYRLDRQALRKISSQTSDLLRIYGEMAAVKEETEKTERHLFSEEAVLTHKIQDMEERENVLSSQWNEGCHQVSILVPEHIGNVLEKKKQRAMETEDEYQKNEERYRDGQNEKTEQLHKIEELKRRQSEIRNACDKLEDYFVSYSVEKKKKDQLSEIYHVKENENLEDVIADQLRKLILDSELKRREIHALEKQFKRLNEDTPAEVSAAVAEVMEHIRRCHGVKCVFGGDYLFDIDDYDRKVLLERLPFLPESVIVEEGMKEIREDTVLRSRNFGDVVIPVLSLNQVLSQESVVDEKNVLFLSNNLELYKEPEIRKQACEEIREKIEEANGLLKRLSDREKTVEEDRKDISAFAVQYEQPYKEKTEHLRNLKKELEETVRSQEQVNLRIGELDVQLKCCTERLERLADERTRNLEEIEVLEKLQQIFSELSRTRKEIERLQACHSKNRSDHDQVVEKLSGLQKQLLDLDVQKQNLRESRKNLEETWKAVYLPYYTGENNGEADDEELSGEVLEARFNGLREAYEQEHSDLEDKRLLLDSYWQMMDTSLKLIHKRGLNPEMLDQMQQEHRLVFTSQEDVAVMEAAIASMEKHIEEQEQILSQYSENKNKLYGSVEQGVRGIEEKYGTFTKVLLSGHDYSKFAGQQKDLLAKMREKQQKAIRNIEKSEQEIRSLEEIRKDLERLIRDENLLFNRTTETYGPDVDLHKKYRELTEYYVRLRAEIRRKQEGYLHEKSNTVEELRKISAVELAESIRTETGTPGTVSEAEYLIQQLKETAEIVQLEKERIEKTIQDMLCIKENFEKQCLQRCVSIRAELERFPMYSKIMLDGQQIPMVLLKIPYVKEEMYAQRMSEYIDGLVAKADTYDSAEEQVAYIRKQLSWKRIFSVIVTDMNSIRLSLYKRERVKEQSRYLKYEEAVGSTGQSQGIYIQFLIGVINYISMVYSGSGDGMDLKKVIFIDNPFGAAKDIYIWQPIFELLQKNRVQLIVPTRGATPAITGKFDVNYILGQKMIDKVQQTVVVDYSSNVDIENMSYEKLEFEQEVFDFI